MRTALSSQSKPQHIRRIVASSCRIGTIPTVDNPLRTAPAGVRGVIFCVSDQLPPHLFDRKSEIKTGRVLLLIEHYLPCSIVTVVNRLTKFVALTVLALWGLAAMHCPLEAVQGLEFLKNCCLVESAASSPDDCTSEGCCAVEDDNYRPEEQTASVPQLFLVLALLSPVIEVPLPEHRADSVIASPSPPELSKVWQFSHRMALLPRAPSHVV
jgi:hypothetical protein